MTEVQVIDDVLAEDQTQSQDAPKGGAVLVSVRGFPPNYAKIVEAFPFVKTAKGPLFCYGTTVYYTGTDKPDLALMRHEGVHSMRQGADPDGWWDRYIKDKPFRFVEELLAHRVEWQTYEKYGRNERRCHKKQIAERLAGPLYGHMVKRNAAVALLTASPGEIDDAIFQMMGEAA